MLDPVPADPRHPCADTRDQPRSPGPTKKRRDGSSSSDHSGIGPIGATAFAAAVTDPRQFRSGRQLAAWLGLTPLQNSSGGKERLGRISKMGDRYLRRLLIIGATALVRQFPNRPDKATPHFASALARKPVRVATVAMADKMARIVWALMTRGETYRQHIPRCWLHKPITRSARPH
jgi:transposase